LQETKQFQVAFTAVDGVGQPLLDDLAIAERLQGQEIATASAKRIAKGQQSLASHKDCPQRWTTVDRSSGYINGFCLPDAGYYSKIGDPPSTGVFRRALALIGQFAQALLSLADGTSASVASAQVQQLAGNAAALSGELAGATGVGAAIGPAVGEIAKALSPLLTQVAASMTAAQERQVILDAQAKVGTLIAALRNATPALFDTLTQQTQNAIDLADHPAASDLARIEGYRVTLSDYAVLLGRLDQAWNQLVAAAKQPNNPVTLIAMTQTSAQIVADAAAVRQSLALLRRGGAVN
jgi:hypothetical protein